MSKPDRALGVALLVAAVALAGVIASEWQAGQALKARLERQVRSGTGHPAPLTILPPFALQPQQAYSGIVQHPLFTPTRQPAPAASASAEPPRKLMLTGIATNPSESVVLLKDLQTGKTERLRAGAPGDAAGLQLESVDGSTVTLKQGNAQLKLDLQVAPSPGAAVPPGAAPAGPGQAAPVVAAPGGRPSAASAPLAAGAPAVKPGGPPAQPSKAAAPAAPATGATDPGLILLNQQRAKQGLPPLSP